MGWEQNKAGLPETDGRFSHITDGQASKPRVDISKYMIDPNPRIAKRDSGMLQSIRATPDALPRRRSSDVKPLQDALDDNLGGWYGATQTAGRFTPKPDRKERDTAENEFVTRGILRGIGKTPERNEVTQRYSQLAAQITKPSTIEPASLKPGYLTSKLALAKAALTSGSLSANHLPVHTPAYGGDSIKSKLGGQNLMHLLSQQQSEQDRLQQKLEQFSLPKDTKLYKRSASPVSIPETANQRLPLGQNTIESLREFRSKMREHYAFEQMRGHHTNHRY